MGVLDALLLIAGCAAVAIGRRFFLYPCHPRDWRYAFGTEYEEQRRCVRDAKQHKRDSEGEASRQVAQVRARVSQIEREGRRHVRKLEMERDGHRAEPSEAAELDGLGSVQLHSRALVFLNEKDEHADAVPAAALRLPLAGVTAECRPDLDNLYIEVTHAGNCKHIACYPRTQHAEDAVHRFAVAIQRQAAKESREQGERERRASELESEIRHTEEETAEKGSAARQALAELTEAQLHDASLAAAKKLWEEACDEWERLTGRRPR